MHPFRGGLGPTADRRAGATRLPFDAVGIRTGVNAVTKSAEEFGPDLNWALDGAEPYRAPWDWMRLAIDDASTADSDAVTRGDTAIIEQPGGRTLWMVSLHQYATYGG